jgi:hypothetical protein
MGDAGRKRIRDRFTIATVADQWLRVYDQVAAV